MLDEGTVNQTTQRYYSTRSLFVTDMLSDAHSRVFSRGAQSFLAALCDRFAERVSILMAQRVKYQDVIDTGIKPDFRQDTEYLRQSDWRIQGPVEDGLKEFQEITAAPKRHTINSVLQTGSILFVADFEDSMAPVWERVLDGQMNLCDAIHSESYWSARQNDDALAVATGPILFQCRVRGLHMTEKHVLWDGCAIPAALFDFAVYFYNNHRQLLEKQCSPHFCLPKLQSYEEACWWSDVFHFTEQLFGLGNGTIKATVLIETLPAAFQMEEILFALKEHAVGLKFDIHDYIFSYIKTLKNHRDSVLPEGQAINLKAPFVDACCTLLAAICDKREAIAFTEPTGTYRLQQSEYFQSLDSVGRDQKTRVSAEQLLCPCSGPRTEQGMRQLIVGAIKHIEACLSDNGCESHGESHAATVFTEVARVSIWQWIQHKQRLDNGSLITKARFCDYLSQEINMVRKQVGAVRFDQGRYSEAAYWFAEQVTCDQLSDFLSLNSYESLP